jgi:hypothetical protein
MSAIWRSAKNWKSWDLLDWSCSLFEHFFLDVTGDDDPVSCLPINKELLTEIAGATNVESGLVEKCFLDAIGRDGSRVARKLTLARISHR